MRHSSEAAGSDQSMRALLALERRRVRGRRVVLRRGDEGAVGKSLEGVDEQRGRGVGELGAEGRGVVVGGDRDGSREQHVAGVHLLVDLHDA